MMMTSLTVEDCISLAYTSDRVHGFLTEQQDWHHVQQELKPFALVPFYGHIYFDLSTLAAAEAQTRGSSAPCSEIIR